MPLYPNAVQMLVAQGIKGNPAQQDIIKPCGVIVHTNASNTSVDTLRRAYTIGSGYGGGEAHFDIEVAPPYNKGRLAQFVDTDIQADNNYKANGFSQGGVWKGWISIETGDRGQPYTLNFTDLGQRAQLVALLVWLCKTHGIPPIVANDPFGVGIGWHSMWGYNYYGSGNGRYGHYTTPSGLNLPLTNPWTNTAGKICPGPTRGVSGGKIGEMPSIIAEVAMRLAPLPPPPPPVPVDPFDSLEMDMEPYILYDTQAKKHYYFHPRGYYEIVDGVGVLDPMVASGVKVRNTSTAGVNAEKALYPKG